MMLDAKIKDYFISKGIHPKEVNEMKNITIWELIRLENVRQEQRMFQDMIQENKKLSKENIQRILEQANNGREFRHS